MHGADTAFAADLAFYKISAATIATNVHVVNEMQKNKSCIAKKKFTAVLTAPWLTLPINVAS